MTPELQAYRAMQAADALRKQKYRKRMRTKDTEADVRNFTRRVDNAHAARQHNKTRTGPVRETP